MSEYPAELYAPLHTGTPGDVGFYQRVCAGVGAVLELGCGHGRVLLELLDAVEPAARPEGPEEGSEALVGLDCHEGLLGLARRRHAALPSEQAARVALVDGDMRSFSLGRRFDRVIIPHSSLFCLLSDEDVLACLACVRRHLRPDGLLVLDAYCAAAFHGECEPEDLSADELVPVGRITTDDGREFSVLERSVWRREEQFILSTYVYRQGPEDSGTEASIPQRYLLMHQLESLLNSAGFIVVAASGGFAGEALDDRSEQLVVTARLA